MPSATAWLEARSLLLVQRAPDFCGKSWGRSRSRATPLPKDNALPKPSLSDNQPQCPAQWKVLIRSQLFAQSLNKPFLPAARISCPTSVFACGG